MEREVWKMGTRRYEGLEDAGHRRQWWQSTTGEEDDRTTGSVVRAGAIGQDETALETSVSTGTGRRSIIRIELRSIQLVDCNTVLLFSSSDQCWIQEENRLSDDRSVRFGDRSADPICGRFVPILRMTRSNAGDLFRTGDQYCPTTASRTAKLP